MDKPRSLTVPIIPDRDARLQWIYGHGDELGAAPQAPLSAAFTRISSKILTSAGVVVSSRHHLTQLLLLLLPSLAQRRFLKLGQRQLLLLQAEA